LLNSSPDIINVDVLNNGSHGFYIGGGSYPQYFNLNLSGNLTNEIRIYNSTITTSGTWKYHSEYNYIIEGDVIINGGYHSPRRLTIEKGMILYFMPGTKILVGAGSSQTGYGELYAEGTADSVITFKPYNDLSGGWGGLFFDNYSNGYGATSLLKHCIVEKGSQYNVYSNTTNQPTIDSCIFRHSSGYGIRLNSSSIVISNSLIENNSTRGIYSSNSSPNISKSQISNNQTGVYFENGSPIIESSKIIDNQQYGIYISGTPITPTIGGGGDKVCDLYYNGLFDIYNNSVDNIVADSNFWNIYPSMIESRIYDYYDNPSKGFVQYLPYMNSGVAPPDSSSIIGDLIYDNIDSTKLVGSKLIIHDLQSYSLDSCIADPTGGYLISGIINGDYTLSFSDLLWGGVNSTDALLVMQHFAHIITLENLKLQAADVNASNSVNGTDALLIMKRFSSLIDDFPSGDWVMSVDSLSIQGSDILSDEIILSYGDVNGSYLVESKGGIELYCDGTTTIESFQGYSIPVIVDSDYTIGAMSMIFEYPEEYIQMNNISISGGSNNYLFNSNDGYCTLAWADLNSNQLYPGDTLITLEIETKDISNLSENICISLNVSSEIADGNAEPLQDVVITMPELSPLMTSIPINIQEDEDLEFNIYPNPFNQQTQIEYYLEEEGFVSLKIINNHGEELKSLIDKNQNTGLHRIHFDGSGLNAGIYYCVIEFLAPNNEVRIVRKMLISR